MSVAEANVRMARTNLADTVIYAPYAGVITNKAALTSIIVLSIIALMAIFVPFFWPYGYADIDYGNIACAPSWWPDASAPCYSGGYHIFGMDQNGRDLFIRVLDMFLSQLHL